MFVVLHIYEARSIFLLFCNHQDTASKSQTFDTGVAGLILTLLKYPMLFWTMISIHKNMGGNLWHLFVFIDIEQFLYYILLSKSLNLIHETQK